MVRKHSLHEKKLLSDRGSPKEMHAVILIPLIVLRGDWNKDVGGKERNSR